MFSFLGDIFDTAIDETKEFFENPVEKTIDMFMSPIYNAVEIIDGLTEGELRTKATISLGIDVAAGMALSELIEWYKNA